MPENVSRAAVADPDGFTIYIATPEFVRHEWDILGVRGRIEAGRPDTAIGYIQMRRLKRIGQLERLTVKGAVSASAKKARDRIVSQISARVKVYTRIGQRKQHINNETRDC